MDFSRKKIFHIQKILETDVQAMGTEDILW